MQGALPPAPPASPRNSRGATPCQAINFDIFRHIERECSQGFKGGDFRRKYYPSLDGTERHTALAEGKATRLSLLPHGECGVWGNAPRVKFRDGVRPPFSKGEEDWGLPPRFREPISRPLLFRFFQLRSRVLPDSGTFPAHFCTKKFPQSRESSV